MSRLRRLALLAAVVVGVGVAVLVLAVQASRPVRSGTLRVAALGAPVEIVFDARGRPYVQAASLGDAFFAEGFLHARDRLWQMELVRRAGLGRLAEILGPSLLPTDRELWTAGVPQLAAQLEANARPATRALVQHYVDGVNAALASLPVRPPELLLAGIAVRPWEPADVYAVAAIMAFDSGNNADNELLRLALSQALEADAMQAFLPDESRLPDFPHVVPAPLAEAFERFAARDPAEQPGLASVSLGSNGWAVAPERSASGHALFAFDSHDALSIPNLLYEVHLFFGDRQIRGFSVAGLPGVINGFNERMAWGFTNTGDSQDLFVETRDELDPLRFLGPEGWYSARQEKLRIPVAGRDEPEHLTVVHTRNGPLVGEAPPVSMAWAGHRVGGFGLDALFDLNLARSWEETSAALDGLAAPSANATYADVDGRIAFRSVGLLPERASGDGRVPLAGHRTATPWLRMLPMEDLPRRVDPPEGFVAAANARVNAPGAGPLVSADNAPGYRIARIQDVLSGSDRHTPAGMRALQTDWHNGQAERLLPALLASLGSAPLDEPAASAREILGEWQAEPRSEPDQAGPLIFERWYLQLAEDLFRERLGEDLYAQLLRRNYVLNHALDGLILQAEPSPAWWAEGRPETVRNAFVGAVAGLRQALGEEPRAWRWDARHAVTFRHELAKAVPLLAPWLDRGPYPWGGGHATVGRARYRYDRPDQVSGAATVRLVIEMSDPMRIWARIPGGQSGHPADPHYDDQIGPYLRGEYDEVVARFEDAEGTRLRLEPDPPG